MTRNAQDIIDDMRNIVKPRIEKMLLEANFEGCGKEDKDEFETEFEIILTLAEKALEQEPKTGHWITKEAYSEDKAMGFTEQIVCSNCDMQNSYFSEWDECKNPISKTFIRSKYCPNCGAKMESEVKPNEENKTFFSQKGNDDRG